MSNESVRLWLMKAENDLKVCRHERAASDPANDAICFHAQQCVEKYLKAFIVHQGQDISKTHVIHELIESCIEIDKSFSKLADSGAASLTRYAVDVRYPDDFYIPQQRGSRTRNRNCGRSAAFRAKADTINPITA